MTENEFEKLLERALESIPVGFRSRMDNVAICFDDVCVDDPDLLGLYEGVALTERGAEPPLLPDKITLFRETIQGEAEDTDGDVYRVVRETLIHEIAHYFGLDEDDVEERFEKRWDSDGQSTIGP
jgi:predicted Zn-dependent protease with MMP-like domain